MTQIGFRRITFEFRRPISCFGKPMCFHWDLSRKWSDPLLEMNPTGRSCCSCVCHPWKEKGREPSGREWFAKSCSLWRDGGVKCKSGVFFFKWVTVSVVKVKTHQSILFLITSQVFFNVLFLYFIFPIPFPVISFFCCPFFFFFV